MSAGAPIPTLAARFRKRLARLPAPAPYVAVAPDLLVEPERWLREAGLHPPYLVLADARTWEIAGRTLQARLEARALVLDSPRPPANTATLARIEEALHPGLCLIAVGCGTLNDLAKLAAGRLGLAQAVFATAPSMNGWITATATLTTDRRKESLPVPPPRGAFFDLTLLARAPARLIRAGLGDALCRATAEVDAFLGHLLQEAPFAADWFDFQRDLETALIGRAGRLALGDREAVELLVWLHLAGGLAMLEAGSSRPASQGEHLIAHAIDLFADPDPHPYHGEAVAVATLTAAALQERLFANKEPPALRPAAHIPEGARDVKGLADPARVAALAAALREHWPALRRFWRQRGRTLGAFRRLFESLGLPRTPADIGLDPGTYARLVRRAPWLRDRFTVLDLALLASALEDPLPA